MSLIGCALLLLLCFVLKLSAIEDNNNIQLSFVILSQDNGYHKRLAQQKHNEIQKQIEELHLVNVKIYSTHNEFHSIVGYWTIFPLLRRLSQCNQCSWFFFCEDTTYVNVGQVLNVLSKYNASNNVFAGYALKDKEPTIIHHFASTDSTGILYPHFAPGFFLSASLVKRLSSRLPPSQEYAFSIDAKYEFAKFIWDGGTGTKLSHMPRLCIIKNSPSCASWMEEHHLICEEDEASLRKIFIAVKTCQKYHNDRVSVVKNTWAKDSKYVSFFSDIEDSSIPTIKLDVENVANGHCEKTLAIMKYYVDKNIVNEWIVIVDDDTLLSFPRLKRVLACYNSSETIALGEKYGYSVANGFGYDYITGGGGMVFSMPTIQQLVKYCRCPSIDSPDDMILGMCLKNLDIPVIHSPFFHQARPIDYAFDFLKPLKHVSFHKHWMIDTYAVYKKWLQDDKTIALEPHSEL